MAETISTEEFFASRSVTNMKISPDGKHVATTYEEGSEVRLAVMDIKSKKILSSFRFGDNMHVINFHWANDTRVLMEVTEILGNLMKNTGKPVNLYAANLDGKDRSLIFETRRASYLILNLLRDEQDKILIGRRHFLDDKGLKAFKLDIYTGKQSYLADQPKGVVSSLLANNDGKVTMGFEYREGDTTDEEQTVLHYKFNNDWKELKLLSARTRPIANPVGFSVDNKKAYFLSNFDQENNDKMALYEYNLETAKTKLVLKKQQGSLTGIYRGYDGEVIAASVFNDTTNVSYINASHIDAKLMKGLSKAFKNEKVRLTSFSDQGDRVIFRTRSDSNPGKFYLFDGATGEAKYLASTLPGLDKKTLASSRVIRFKARDGVELEAILTLPNGQDKDLPLIVNPHGGPYGISDQWGFNPEAQFFAHHGYATLQINFRGSGNYGDDFERLGRLQWGRSMQDDVTDGTLWAIKNKIADADRVCIYGGSYGGYAALWGVIKEPDLYQCSVGYVGVYDMNIFFQSDGSDASKRKSTSKYLKSHIGTDEKYLSSISPVEHVDKIKADLFIVHGSEDARVPLVHAENLRDALDEIDKDYKWMVKKEGHGFYQLENKVELYNSMLSFFDQHIGK